MSSNRIEARRPRRWLGVALRGLALLGLVSLGTTYSIIWFKSLATPSARTLGLWAVVLALSLVIVTGRTFRVVCANLLGIVGGLWAFEAYSGLATHEDHPAPPSNSVGYYSMERGEILGFGPTRDFVNHSRLERDGQLIYDVTYSIDAQGLRVAPPASAEPEGTLLFFGDSFTFGEGLQDREALPYRVGELARGRYRVYNFAFQGYGPHQMLSAIEHGLVDSILGSSIAGGSIASDNVVGAAIGTRQNESAPRGNVVAVYQAIPDHVRRSAGLAFYDTHGPKYLLEPGGEPRFAGHFDDDGYAVFLRKFFLYQRVASVRTEVDAGDIELFGAIVAAARRRLSAAYGAQFHVLLWDDPTDRHTPAVARTLQQHGLPPHLVSKVLPGYPARAAEYTITGDGHPSARANQIIAEYILERFVPAPGARPALLPASSAAPP